MRILLVDDDENLMASLAERLIQQRYAVDIAIDGSSAETYVDLFDYDLIVLDLMLPDGDGIQFCRRFRSKGYGNPLMILTAKESTAQKVEALDAGADDYVIKPFDFDELCARIRALLRREHQGLPTVLSLGPLRLDPSACETTYDNNPVRLTPKEFSMMELFLRHPYRVFSLGAIIDDLWSFEDPPGEDAVRTHIKGLRRKLKAAGAPKDLIKTVYGLGYRLNENTIGSTAKPSDQALRQENHSSKGSSEDVQDRRSLKQWTEKWQSAEKRTVPPHSAAGLEADRAHEVANASPEIMVSEVNFAHQAKLSEQLVQAYRRYLGTASRQVVTLEKLTEKVVQVLSAHQSVSAVSSSLLEEGRICAHKLVGSLGSFGIAEGSQLARKIECALEKKSKEHITEKLVSQLDQWVRALRSQIDQATVQSATEALAASVQEGLPVVLIVSEDSDLAQSLTQCAFQVDLRAQIVATTGQASAVLELTTCDLLIIDMHAVSAERLPAFCQQIKQSYDLPIVLLSGQLTIAQRLSLIQQGLDIVTHRSALPLQVLTAAAGIIRAQVSAIRVAIADDDPNILTLLQTSLKPWGFQVNTFERATHLWKWLADEPIAQKADILVLDIEMPEMSGLDLCKILRADARFQAVPILFLTNHQEENLRIQAYQLGADDFIHKAVAPTELATRLRNQLTRACLAAVSPAPKSIPG